jgi:hypothetical protein
MPPLPPTARGVADLNLSDAERAEERAEARKWLRKSRVPKPYAPVDVLEAFAQYEFDLLDAIILGEGPGSLEDALLVLRNQVPWARYWSQHYPNRAARPFWGLAADEAEIKLRRRGLWRD